MSDTKRVIKINTELFKIPHMTRKNKKPPVANGGIKVKTPAKEQNNATLKRKLMKFIRNQHDQKIKNTEPPTADAEFKSEFKESLDYLAKVAKESDSKIQASAHNRTLKSYSPISNQVMELNPKLNMNHNQAFELKPKLNLNPIPNPMVPVMNPMPTVPVMNPMSMPNPMIPVMNPISMPNPMVPVMNPMSMPIINTMPAIASLPQYGCLKGGSLPLYKNWKNITQRNNAIPPPLRVNPNPQIPISNNPIVKPKHNKRKRTIRRTYKIGRSKIAPKVTVLVSNRTIRNNITTKTQLLKQAPIGEVRKYLIKNGFIKIGSIAPNDVLRKIYETATLICGDVTNHNPDNLLYNFMNGQETH